MGEEGLGGVEGGQDVLYERKKNLFNKKRSLGLMGWLSG